MTSSEIPVLCTVNMPIPSQTNPYLQRVSGVDLAKLHERIKTTANYRRPCPVVEVLEITAPPIIEGEEIVCDGFSEYTEETMQTPVPGPLPLPEYFTRISADIEAALAVGEADWEMRTPITPMEEAVRTMMLDEGSEDEFILDLTEVVE